MSHSLLLTFDIDSLSAEASAEIHLAVARRVLPEEALRELPPHQGLILPSGALEPRMRRAVEEALDVVVASLAAAGVATERAEGARRLAIRIPSAFPAEAFGGRIAPLAESLVVALACSHWLSDAGADNSQHAAAAASLAASLKQTLCQRSRPDGAILLPPKNQGPKIILNP